jgi:hypothetical protein
MEKKRHHYVPTAYLKFFTDKDGKVYIHLKDEPDKVIHQTPDNTAFHKYFYSQPLPGGGRDNNTLEDLFCKVEDKWSPLVERLQRREPINLEDLYEFIVLQRSRVPAVRDAAEKIRAESVRIAALTMDKAGRLPPKPDGHPDIIEKAVISIDPHQSILAIPAFMQAMGRVIDMLGFGVLHNTTDTPFLTSDNPVVYFDPRRADDDMLPYTIDRDDRVVAFQFPITPKVMLYGYSEIRAPFRELGLRHADLDDPEKVDTFNRLTCRFGYRAVFSQMPGAKVLAREYAATSPIVRTMIVPQERGHLLMTQSVFGPRVPKPKWTEKP